MQKHPAATIEDKKPTGTLWRLVRYSGLVLFALLLISMDWKRAWSILKAADPVWILIAGGLNAVFLILKALRWYVLLKCQGVNYRLSRAMKVYQASSFFSVITPGRVGDIVKAHFLKRDMGLPHSLGMVSVVMDRLLDLFCLMGSAFLFTLLVNTPFEMVWMVVLVGVITVTGTLVLSSERALRGILVIMARIPGLGAKILGRTQSLNDAQSAFRALLGPKLALPVLLSICAYATLYGGGYALAQAQSLPLSLIQCAYCIALANIVSLLPVSISGIGTRDVTMVVLFAGMGLEREQALIFSFGYLVLSLVFGNGLGAIYWFSESRTPESPLDSARSPVTSSNVGG